MLTEEGVTTRLDSLITKGVQERDWDIKEGSDPRRFVPPFAGFGSSNCGPSFPTWPPWPAGDFAAAFLATVRDMRPDQCVGGSVPIEGLEDKLGDYLVSVADDEEVRQGDLIRRFVGPDPEGEWGFVLTADC
jgi:hypothetical protein